MDDDFEPIDRERLAKALQTVPLAEFLESGDLDVLADAIAAAYQAVVDEPLDDLPPVVGEVGTLTGPPIMGTRDTINAGPARRINQDEAVWIEAEIMVQDGLILKDGATLYGEVVGLTDPPTRPTPGPWKPAGEVGVVTGTGTSVVEEPKNDARPAIKRVGPGA